MEWNRRVAEPNIFMKPNDTITLPFHIRRPVAIDGEDIPRVLNDPEPIKVLSNARGKLWVASPPGNDWPQIIVCSDGMDEAPEVENGLVARTSMEIKDGGNN